MASIMSDDKVHICFSPDAVAKGQCPAGLGSGHAPQNQPHCRHLSNFLNPPVPAASYASHHAPTRATMVLVAPVPASTIDLV